MFDLIDSAVERLPGVVAIAALIAVVAFTEPMTDAEQATAAKQDALRAYTPKPGECWEAPFDKTGVTGEFCEPEYEPPVITEAERKALAWRRNP